MEQLGIYEQLINKLISSKLGKLDSEKFYIKESIIEEKVIRVTGHSGLGKTRLVLEAFRETDLTTSIVYYNLEGNENISEIIS